MKRLMAKLLRREEPQKLRYIFVVAYGRSGSTLLMNLLNSDESCCIRGENNNALYSLYESCKKIREAQQSRGRKPQKITSPWRGIDSVNVDRYAERLAKIFTEEVICPKLGVATCGFKEIRHLPKDVPDLEQYLDFIARVFPGARFIFNHRNIDDVAKSKWWADMPRARSLLEEVDARFNQFRDPGRFFHFSYDAALQRREHVMDLFEFAGLDYDSARIDRTFSTRHSY